MLVLAGILSLRQVSLDALPDISDVEVIVHTEWTGEPPTIIEDQVTYPIVTSLLAAPQVKAVRAQTMFGDSYVFVVFQDGTDLYWARSRVVEYLQQIQGKLPQGVHPSIGPDATGAGWVYEYVIGGFVRHWNSSVAFGSKCAWVGNHRPGSDRAAHLRAYEYVRPHFPVAWPIQIEKERWNRASAMQRY